MKINKNKKYLCKKCIILIRMDNLQKNTEEIDQWLEVDANEEKIIEISTKNIDNQEIENQKLDNSDLKSNDIHSEVIDKEITPEKLEISNNLHEESDKSNLLYKKSHCKYFCMNCSIS